MLTSRRLPAAMRPRGAPTTLCRGAQGLVIATPVDNAVAQARLDTLTTREPQRYATAVAGAARMMAWQKQKQLTHSQANQRAILAVMGGQSLQVATYIPSHAAYMGTIEFTGMPMPQGSGARTAGLNSHQVLCQVLNLLNSLVPGCAPLAPDTAGAKVNGCSVHEVTKGPLSKKAWRVVAPINKLEDAAKVMNIIEAGLESIPALKDSFHNMAISDSHGRQCEPGVKLMWKADGPDADNEELRTRRLWADIRNISCIADALPGATTVPQQALRFAAEVNRQAWDSLTADTCSMALDQLENLLGQKEGEAADAMQADEQQAYPGHEADAERPTKAPKQAEAAAAQGPKAAAAHNTEVLSLIPPAAPPSTEQMRILVDAATQHSVCPKTLLKVVCAWLNMQHPTLLLFDAHNASYGCTQREQNTVATGQDMGGCIRWVCPTKSVAEAFTAIVSVMSEFELPDRTDRGPSGPCSFNLSVCGYPEVDLHLPVLLGKPTNRMHAPDDGETLAEGVKQMCEISSWVAEHPIIAKQEQQTEEPDHPLYTKGLRFKHLGGGQEPLACGDSEFAWAVGSYRPTKTSGGTEQIGAPLMVGAGAHTTYQALRQHGYFSCFSGASSAVAFIVAHLRMKVERDQKWESHSYTILPWHSIGLKTALHSPAQDISWDEAVRWNTELLAVALAVRDMASGHHDTYDRHKQQLSRQIASAKVVHNNPKLGAMKALTDGLAPLLADLQVPGVLSPQAAKQQAVEEDDPYLIMVDLDQKVTAAKARDNQPTAHPIANLRADLTQPASSNASGSGAAAGSKKRGASATAQERPSERQGSINPGYRGGKGGSKRM